MLINLIIIYFACGSPIGVYRITRSTRLRSPRQAAAVGAYFVLWPIFAPAILRRSLSDNATLLKSNIERAIANIRIKMDSLAFAESSNVSVFEFRDIFERFTFLTMALKCIGLTNAPSDLFRIARHENAALASACMDRRNRRRLSFHQSRSRKEFVDLIAIMARLQPNGIEILELGLQLARLLNDKEAIDDFSALLSKRLAASG